MEQPNCDTQDRGLPAALAWACFLGSSWTWVIGMVVPALFVRDYGWMGFVAFALPNVLGAAAMGFVLKDARASSDITRRHQDMCLRFSDVTIAYHAFVMSWLWSRLLGWPIVIGGLGLALFFWLLVQRRSATRTAAVIVSVTSLMLFVVSWLTDHAWAGLWQDAPRMGTMDLLLFAPAAAMGFLLCPYLDLTFHRVRQSTDPQTGQRAFAIGFGGIFLCMILFSLVYLWVILTLTGSDASTYDGSTLLWSILAIHLTLQSAFTLAVHAREITVRRGTPELFRIGVMVCAGLLLGSIALSAGTRAFGLTLGEVFYRCFLLAYGLPFPAYVLLCMIPTRRPIAGRTRVIVWLIATLVSLPFGYHAFMADTHAGLIVVGIVLLLARGAIDLLPFKPVTIPSLDDAANL